MLSLRSRATANTREEPFAFEPPRTVAFIEAVSFDASLRSRAKANTREEPPSHSSHNLVRSLHYYKEVKPCHSLMLSLRSRACHSKHTRIAFEPQPRTVLHLTKPLCHVDASFEKPWCKFDTIAFHPKPVCQSINQSWFDLLMIDSPSINS
jgi:hypothetical protein